MRFEIRDYRDEDRDEWMQVHAKILMISHAWNYCIQERPVYERDSVCLVALCDGKIAGLMDAEIDREPGDVCYLKDSRGAYVVEFGRLPEYAGHNLGLQMIEVMKRRLSEKGIRRMEFWTQDPGAQQYYRKIGLREIQRHMRFRFKPDRWIKRYLEERYIGVEYIYGVCLPEVYPLVKRQYEIMTRHPLEPHLCIGYEMRY